MVDRILNRRELRKQADQADQADQAAVPNEKTAAPARKKAVKAKAPASPKVRKPRAKKPAPRLRVRWGIFNANVKQVAIFDYNQRLAADAKLADLLAQNKGLFYMQMVKEPIPEPVPPVAAGDD
ncbi:MAG: hypothetical protein ACK4RK_09010 [Gemmataceae bacterium]